MSKRYWFTAKRFGWGWTPATWEGWLSLGIYLAFVALITWESDLAKTSSKEVIVREGPSLVFITLILLVICWFKGERPRWRWGK